MKRSWVLMALVALLGAALATCGTTPQPTVPPPTQTPWIIVVTATPGSQDVAQAPPTPVVVTVVVTATPTRSTAATATATLRPTEGAPTATLRPTEETPSATPGPTASATAATPTPTNTPAPGDLTYQAPLLTEPADGAPYSWGSTVLIKWTSVGELAEDEYYRLDLERPPQTATQPWYGDYIFTKNTSHLLEGTFLAPFHLPAEQGLAQVYWSVRIVRQTGVDENGKPVGVDLSLPSEKRNFTLDPKPSDA